MISMCMALTDTKDITQTYYGVIVYMTSCIWIISAWNILLNFAKMKELCRSTPPKTDMKPENNFFERVHFG